MESAAGPQLLAVCFSYGGEPSIACGGGGANVGVGGTGVATSSGVEVTALVGPGRLVVVGAGVFGNAVGALPTGLITFLRYVLATSYRQPIRLLMAGICSVSIIRVRKPIPINRILLFDMQTSVPKLDESKLIHL